MTRLQRRDGSLVLGVCALGLLAALGCDTPPPAVGGGAVARQVDAAPAHDPLTSKLIAGKWAGTLGDLDPLELTFTTGRDSLAAQAVFTRFGRPLVREHFKVALEQPATVRLKSTRATALVGKGPAPVHEITGTLAADGTTLAGTSLVAGHPKGAPFTASTKKTRAEVDPPLDAAKAEAALLEGRWEGKAGDDPAKLAVTRQGTRLTGRFTHGGTITAAEVKVQPDGVVQLTSSPHRSGQRQVTATFEIAFTRTDLGELGGIYKVVTQLGVVMQAQSYPLALQDRRPRKKSP